MNTTLEKCASDFSSVLVIRDMGMHNALAFLGSLREKRPLIFLHYACTEKILKKCQNGQKFTKESLKWPKSAFIEMRLLGWFLNTV